MCPIDTAAYCQRIEVCARKRILVVVFAHDCILHVVVQADDRALRLQFHAPFILCLIVAQ